MNYRINLIAVTPPDTKALILQFSGLDLKHISLFPICRKYSLSFSASDRRSWCLQRVHRNLFQSVLRSVQGFAEYSCGVKIQKQNRARASSWISSILAYSFQSGKHNDFDRKLLKVFGWWGKPDNKHKKCTRYQPYTVTEHRYTLNLKIQPEPERTAEPKFQLILDPRSSQESSSKRLHQNFMNK